MIAVGKHKEVKKAAEQLFATQPDWVTFYREILGPRGIVRHLFPTREELAKFKQTDDYKNILQLLTKLRELQPAAESPLDQTRVITVRLPKCLHDALRAEAYEHHTSMNKLCISKLLQLIDEQHVPAAVERP